MMLDTLEQSIIQRIKNTDNNYYKDQQDQDVFLLDIIEKIKVRSNKENINEKDITLVVQAPSIVIGQTVHHILSNNGVRCSLCNDILAIYLN